VRVVTRGEETFGVHGSPFAVRRRSQDIGRKVRRQKEECRSRLRHRDETGGGNLSACGRIGVLRAKVEQASLPVQSHGRRALGHPFKRAGSSLVATSAGCLHVLRGAGRMPTLPLSPIRIERTTARTGPRSNLGYPSENARSLTSAAQRTRRQEILDRAPGL
jgi:hypothetical protein